MGKLNHERKLHANYSYAVMQYWEIQPDEFKNKCAEYAKIMKISTLNLFYLFLIAYHMEKFGGWVYAQFKKKAV